MEDFPPRFDPEDRDDLIKLSYVARMWEEHGEGFWVYYKMFRFDKKAPSFGCCQVQFMGCYSDANNFFWDEFEKSCQEEGVEPMEDFAGFCSLEREFYNVLHWRGNDYIYLINT